MKKMFEWEREKTIEHKPAVLVLRVNAHDIGDRNPS